MKTSLLIAAIFSCWILTSGADEDSSTAENKRDLSTDPRIAVLTPWSDCLEIKGIPGEIFAGNPSLETAIVRITVPMPNGEFYTTLTFRRGKEPPDPFHFVIPEADAEQVSIELTEVLLSGGEILKMNLGDLLAEAKGN